MKQLVDWHRFWQQERLGFHEGRVNRYLQRHLASFDIKPGDMVFMPLCGKAVDILWLAQQGYHVVGVELSEIAVRSFFDEAGIHCEEKSTGDFTVFSANGITLYQGDYMHLRAEHLLDCRLVYDRASLVAIEAFNRLSYAQHMLSIIPARTPMLLITLEYDQQKVSGPPFSVPLGEIAELYAAHYRIEVVESHEQVDERPKWRAAGLESMQESALRLVTAA